MVKGFRGDIEGLRGVAVLLVIADHAFGWPRGGFLGVDVFFVLSGFLITGLLVSEVERTGQISLRRFYARRARRLLPAAVLVLVVTDLAAVLLLLPARAHATVVDSLWALGSAANIWFAHLGTDYFANNRPPSPVQHYWSLSVEEQFYVVWPSLILLTLAIGLRAGWTRRRCLLVVAGLVVAGSFAWSVATAGSAYFSSPARAWELGAGAVLALLPAVAGRAGLRQVCAALGAIGLAVSVFVIPTTAVPGYAAALPVLATVALLYGAPPLLGWRPLRFFGLISYSLYLWHWPVLVLAADIPGGTTGPATLLCLALVLGLSAASYRWVETPARQSLWLSPLADRSRDRPRRRLIAPAWALTVVTALAAAFVLTGIRPTAAPAAAPAAAIPDPNSLPDLGALVRKGLSLRRWPEGLGDLTGAGAPEWVRDGCLDVGPRNRERCTYGPKTAETTVAVLGDSIATSWMPTLRAAGGRDWRVHLLTHRQCPMVLVPEGATKAVRESCAQHQQWVIGQVQALRPDVIVLSSRYGGMEPSQWRAGTERALARLAPTGARTFVLEPPPDTGNLQQCRTRLSTPRQCVEPISELHRAFSAAELAATRSGTGNFVDSTDWFCLDGRCPAVIAGTAVHFDGEHLTAAYGQFLGPYLARALRAR